MNSCRAVLLSAALILVSAASLAAADQGGAASPAPAPSSPSDSGAADQSPTPFLAGDQTIGLAAGLQIPTTVYFPATNTESTLYGQLYLGGLFSFSYQYFLTNGLALGGNLAGSFNETIGGSSLFVAPLGATLAYWWALSPFEFSVLAEGGGYLIRYGSQGMLGPFAKAGGGVYYRITSGWSLGLQAYYWLVPELHASPYTNYNALSGFVETSVAAVYHL